MIPMNIAFIGKDDPPNWNGEFIDCGVLEDVNILEGGMTSGLPSVAVRLKLPLLDKTGQPVYAVAQQTARQIVSLARILMGKYPQLMSEETDAKTTDIVGMLQALRARDLEVYVLSREQLDRLLARVKP